MCLMCLLFFSVINATFKKTKKKRFEIKFIQENSQKASAYGFLFNDTHLYGKKEKKTPI